MSKIYPLFSSSKGNATFIGSNSGGILIDAGVTYKRLLQAMKKCELSIEAIKAVFITHEHSDHIKGLYMLTKNLPLTVYGKGNTLRQLIDNNSINPNSNISEINSPVSILDMELTSFDTPHDSEQSCGYKIKFDDQKSCAVCTDLGYITKSVDEHLQGCDLVLLEANYDEKMLFLGPYPPYVKNRIKSDKGHLSNKDSAKQIRKLVENGTTRIILGHLSQENNTPEIAEETVLQELKGLIRNKDYMLSIAPVETLGKAVVF
jgi:phosphoribosyl 1,2-cyclic phosphodiesterase